MSTAEILYDFFGPGCRTILQRGPSTFGIPWEPAENGEKWTSPKDGRRDRMLRPVHVANHLDGVETWGARPGPESRYAVVDVDTHVRKMPIPAELCHNRRRAVVAAVRDVVGVEPLVVSTPSAPGCHVWLTSAVVATADAWAVLLGEVITAAFGRPRQEGVDVFRPGVGEGVRLPCGVGWADKNWVETRVIDPESGEPVNSNRAADVALLPDLLARATVPAELLRLSEPAADFPLFIGPACSTGGTRRAWSHVTARARHEVEPGPGSLGFLEGVRTLVAKMRGGGATRDEILVSAATWAAEHGFDAAKTSRAAAGSLDRLDGEVRAGRFSVGRRSVVQIFGIPGKPRDVAPRLLYEPDVIPAIVAELSAPQRVLDDAATYLGILRAHGTSNTHQERDALGLSTVIVDGRKVRRTVAARQALEGAGWIWRYQPPISGVQVAVYCLDFERGKLLRERLELPPITVDTPTGRQWASCDLVEEITIHTIVGEKPDASTLAGLLADGLDDYLIQHSADPATLAVILDHIRIGGLVEDTPENRAALGEYVYEKPDDVTGEILLGLAFRGLRPLRKRLGLPQPRVRARTADELDKRCPTGGTPEIMAA